MLLSCSIIHQNFLCLQPFPNHELWLSVRRKVVLFQSLWSCLTVFPVSFCLHIYLSFPLFFFKKNSVLAFPGFVHCRWRRPICLSSEKLIRSFSKQTIKNVAKCVPFYVTYSFHLTKKCFAFANTPCQHFS